MQIPVVLDRAMAKPLADQLADALRDAIRQGRVPAGARLPSSRELADQLGLARNTVVRAYETLAMEGLVESRAASGFFATPHLEQARRARGRLESPGARAAKTRPRSGRRRRRLSCLRPSVPAPGRGGCSTTSCPVARTSSSFR